MISNDINFEHQIMKENQLNQENFQEKFTKNLLKFKRQTETKQILYQKRKKDLKLCSYNKKNIQIGLIFQNIKILNLKNSKIKCVESLQAFQWNSLKKLSIPRKQARIKALIKCRLPSLKILDLCQSFKTDSEELSRCAINKIESINLPIHKNSKLGSYLALIKICSQKKRELYLNYLKKLPQNQKCMQEMHLQFQMDCLYSQ